jgi:hypothetical protein
MRKPLFKSRDKNTQGMNVMQGFAAQISDRLNQQAQPKVMALEKRMVAGIPGSKKLTNKETEDEDVNLTLDHDSNQWKVLPSAPDEDKRKVIKFVKEQFDLAYRARREMELEWAMAIAFFEGRQWFTISSQTRNLINLQNPNEANRYITINKMRPLIDGVVGKLTQVGPDARAVPLSQNQRDLLASEEANHICGHYNRKFSRETQLKERVRWACVCGTSYLKIYWNARGEQVMPYFSPDTGEITGYENIQIGDVTEEILPAFDIFLDPTAKRDADVRWLIHAATKPLSWFVDNYGDEGKLVSPDALMGNNASYVDAYLEGGNGSGNGWTPPSTARLAQSDSRKRAAVVYEYWEKPSQQFPSGRYIVSTNTVLLHAGPWLYKKKDEFPFIPLRWQPRSGTPYGHSLGFDLCPLQQTYNRVYSRMLEQFEQQRDYVMVQRLSSVGADAFNHTGDDYLDETRTYKKIYYNPGSAPPVISRAPGIGGDLFPLLQYLEKDMMDIAGLHDVSQGQAPAGTPAEAVTLLQRADNTQHSYVRADIEISAAKIKEWEIALVEEFGVAPFIGNVDEQANPMQKMEQGVISFEHIRNGGQFRIVYIPGSTQEDSPDQKLQKVIAMRQMGLFGDPQDPATNKLVVSMLTLPETAKIINHLNMQEQAMAQQAQMMQEQMAQAQQMETQKSQKFDPEAAQMQTQLDVQKSQAQIEAKMTADIEKMRERSRLTQENDAAKSIVEISQENLRNQIMQNQSPTIGNE